MPKCINGKVADSVIVSGLGPWADFQIDHGLSHSCDIFTYVEISDSQFSISSELVRAPCFSHFEVVQVLLTYGQMEQLPS